YLDQGKAAAVVGSCGTAGPSASHQSVLLKVADSRMAQLRRQFMCQPLAVTSDQDIIACQNCTCSRDASRDGAGIPRAASPRWTKPDQQWLRGQQSPAAEL